MILNGYIFPIIIRCCGAGKSSQKFYFLLLLWVFWGWRVLVPFLEWLRDGRCRSAHAISCFFLFDVCSTSLPSRSAHAISCFFFLTCTVGRLRDGRCRSAHVIPCFFLFDVCSTSLPSRSAHAISCFFLFDVYCVATSGWQVALRTRHFLLFLF